MTTTLIVVALCSVLLALGLSLLVGKSYITADPNPYGSLDRLTIRIHEICQSVLDPKALTFLRENAPAYAISSYRARQQKLAQLSLRVASQTVLHSLTGASSFNSALSVHNTAQSLISKAKVGLLLLVCFVGRVGLRISQYVGAVVSRHIQLWLPARVLSAVGSTVSYLSLDHSDGRGIADGISEAHAPGMASNRDRAKVSVIDEVREALTQALPNDISRMIYVATLRDNNTGSYFHPDLVRRFTATAADRAMLACHQEIYERLVSLDLEDLTDQLDIYFGSIRGPRGRSIENWKKLRAYRAAIPIDVDTISAEILFMKIDVALAILEARLPARTQ